MIAIKLPNLLKYIVILVLYACCTCTVEAHGLSLFANVIGEQAEGHVTYSGGQRAAGISVELRDDESQTLLKLRSDHEGRFLFRLPGPGRFVVVADGGDGHTARFPLELESLSVEQSAENGPGYSDAGMDCRALDRLLARHINPLREQLAAYETQRRWHDVLGGIGYILGLAGTAFFFLGRKGR